MSLLKFERILYWSIVFFIIGIILSGTYLPMVDLPQHAAQVATLDAVLKNQSPWADLIELNFKTPYLIGYLTWLVIYQLFDIVTASKILVAFIFFCYVFTFNELKKVFNSTHLLNWVAIPSFFGFCYQWGFVTFLFSISIGLLFFLKNIQLSENFSLKKSILVIFFGVILFFSHVLSFAFFCFLSFSYLVAYTKDIKKILLKILPIYSIFAGLLVFYLLQKDSLGGFYSYGTSVMWHRIGEKIINLLVYPWSMVSIGYSYIGISIFLLVTPFFLRLKFSKDPYKYTPLVVFLFMWSILPHFLNNTYFIYERFSILFFPFYYLIFENKNNTNPRLKSVIYILFSALIVYLISQIWISIYLAKKDSQDFAEVLKDTSPHKRVLTLAFEPTSPSIGVPFTYVHFGSWYQAEKQGWSDFNFAWFHPQIVRYRSSKVPEVKPGFEWTPLAVQSLQSCTQYDLLFVRAYNPVVDEVIKNSLCKDYSLVQHQGAWLIYAKDNTIKN